MDTWYKQLGYYENPFLINPFKERTPLIGLEDQFKDALYYITSGSIIFMQADDGCGKTKMLRELIKEFRGRIIYVNAQKLTKTLNMEDLLRKRNGMKGKMFGAKPKDMILFLDNIEELSHVNLERLKYYYDQGFLQSIVCTGTDFKKVGFSKSMVQRIGKRVIKLPHLTQEQAVTLALGRLDEDKDTSEPLITEKQIQKIFTAAKKNPQKFLMQLHRVFEEMHFADADSVEDAHLKVLEEKIDKDDTQELNQVLGAEIVDKEQQFVDEKGREIMKVGEYYRCPDQDMFCGNCGAIVLELDTSCPECQALFEAPKVEKKETNNKKGEANA